jgi:hypothetical protein
MSGIDHQCGRRHWFGAAVVIVGLLCLPIVLAAGAAANEPARLAFDFTAYGWGGPSGYTGISLADMDLDGQPDILLGNRDTSSVDIWRNDPHTAGLDHISSIAFPYHVHDVRGDDIDEDGDMDIVVALRNHGVYVADNNSMYGELDIWNVREIDGEYAWQVMVEDFDGDGHLDIFDCVDYGPIKTFYGDGEGNFTPGVDIADPATDMRLPRGFNAVDLDGDGKLDLIGTDGMYMRAFLNPGNRVAAWASVGPSAQFADMVVSRMSSDVSPSAGDLNGDGAIDLVAIRGKTDGSVPLSVLIFEGDPSSPTPKWNNYVLDSISASGFNGHAGVADIDGDGNLDIHVGGANWFSGLIVYLGDGEGNFTRENLRYAPGMGGFNAIAIGDINADEDNDIVAGLSRGGEPASDFSVLLAKRPQPPDGVWSVECFDCPSNLEFNSLTERSLKIDDDGNFHIAYGRNHLFYSTHDGTTWRHEVIDTFSGLHPSLALDASGRAHISYFTYEDMAVRYAHQTGSGWQIETVEMETGTASTSLALDSQGRPHIAYATEYGELRYAHKTANDWAIEKIAVGAKRQSLALDSAGQPHVSFVMDDMLQYGVRTAAGWQIGIVELNNIGHTSIALTEYDTPLIAYEQEGRIRLARMGQIWNSETVDEGQYRSPSLAINASGVPFIAYYDSEIESVKYAYQDASNWRRIFVDSAQSQNPVSLALGADGQVYVAFTDYSSSTNRLKINDETVVEGGGTYGWSVALDANFQPAVSYHDSREKDLLFAHRGNDGWAIQTVESLGDAGRESMVELDGTGKAHIAYLYSQTEGGLYQLKYAYQSGSGWQRELIADETGSYIFGFAVEANGRPHVVYRTYEPNGDDETIYAYRTAAGWQHEPLESSDHRGHEVSLAVDSQGRPHVTYTNYTNTVDEVIYAYRDTGGWHKVVVDSGRDLVPLSTSLALGNDGKPRLVYSWIDGRWVMITYAYLDAGGWHKEYVNRFAEPPEVGGSEPIMALGPDDQPHVTFTDQMAADSEYARYGYRDTAGDWHFMRVPFYTPASPALAIDGEGQPHMIHGSGVRHITLDLPAVNTPPVAANLAVTTMRNTPVPIILSATDADGDALTYAIVANPKHGALNGTAPNLTYMPAAGYSGPDSFTFKANDGTMDSNIATVNITVNPSAGWKVYLPGIIR